MDTTSMGIDEYYNLTNENQIAINDWLESCGGHPKVTRKITIRDNEIYTEEYLVDAITGDMVYDWDVRDVKCAYQSYPLLRDPPVWIGNCPFRSSVGSTQEDD